MKKITDFIVEKRNYILVLFLMLTAICGFLSNKVRINYDMAKYLPDTSTVRTGMDIMEEEFSSNNSSSFNLMFKGLNLEEKEKIYQDLTKIKNVSSVLYEKDNSSYNKDDYTLYVININAKDDSKEATEVYEKVEKKYHDYEIETSGEVAQQNEDVLPAWIMVVAIGICMIILIVMCQSYTEPFLFLLAIGVAVILNSGTNIIFSSVSNITSSIAAILQMALSMDYSIMLMNRYRQEKEIDNDKVRAMKKALYKAFGSISSSSITTIVGLLALVFMSFTIGKDLGFVLAKGVLLSLVSIFFFLPSLILLFDKLITKTKKKSPDFNLEKLGRFSYKIRSIAFVLLIILFVVSFILKGNLSILYTNKEMDKIAEVFEENNQMAIIYNNKYEDLVASYCKKLEKNNKVDEVLCYGNTINEKLTYQELKKKLNSLDSDVNIEEDLLRIVYYNYYNGNKKNKVTFHELVSFLQNEVFNNENFKVKFNSNQNSIDKLNNFTTIENINKQRSSKELSEILGIDEEKLEQLLIYYNSKNINTKMSLNTFTDFVNKEILTDSNYSSSLDNTAKSSLKMLEKYTNVYNITKNMSSSELSSFFGIDEETAESLYLYYYSINGVNTELTLNEFSNFTINYVLSNPSYSNMFSNEMKQKLELLKTFSDKEMINKNMTISEIANVFGMDESSIKQVFLIYYSNKDSGTKMTLQNFVNTINYLKTNTTYLNNIDVSSITSLSNNESIMNNPNLYTASEVANLFSIDHNQVYQLYALIDLANNNTSSWVMSPNIFVNLIIENQEKIGSSMDNNSMQQLLSLQGIMTSANHNIKYSYSQLAKFIGTEESSLKSIYALYTSTYEELTLSPKSFVDFIIINQDNSLLSNNIDSNTINNLKFVQTLMNSSLNDAKYSYMELSNLLGISRDDVSLIYSLYHSKQNSMEISLRELIEFILNDVSQNEKYSSNFDSNSIQSLKTIEKVINGVENNISYTSDEMYSIIHELTDKIDQSTIELLYIYYSSKNNYQKTWTLTIEELIKYLNQEIIMDEKFDNFISDDIRSNMKESSEAIDTAKENLVGKNYSRVVLNTKLDQESKETFDFIKELKNNLEKDNNDIYVIGNSPMAYEMSNTFDSELNFITILTMIAIFVVVAFTFKSISIPAILVLIIQTAVYITMGILSLLGGEVYFIALLIVQSILMGATIDYAILYTSYYKESRNTLDVKESMINAYNRSIHTILTSSSILIIVTLIVGKFATEIAAKICKTISQGTLCSVILILFLLPPILASCDKLIYRKKDK